MEAKNWIAIGAASALSLGVMATGAVSAANALPLISGTTNLDVPGIAVTDDVKRSGPDVGFSVSSDSIMSPSPASSDSPLSPASVSPASPESPASIDSPPSPASIDSPPSPASIDSPASPASIDSPASPGSAD